MSLKIIKEKAFNTKCDLIVEPLDKRYGNTIIHINYPLYINGNNNEYELLRESYRNVLSIAKTNSYKSVAIPLYTRETVDFPKDEVYRIALEEIYDYEDDIDIYLVIDEKYLKVDNDLRINVKEYIKHNFYKKPIKRRTTLKEHIANYIPSTDDEEETTGLKLSKKEREILDENEIVSICNSECIDLNKFELDESFSESLLRIIDEKGLKDSEVYKKVGIDRKLFSRIRSKKNYKPSKKTAIALCIALELDLDETNNLLKKAGFTLSRSYLFDVIIEYFIKNKHYNLYDINAVLLENDQELIGC